MWCKRGSKSEEIGKEGAIMFQILEGRVLQVRVFNSSGREEKIEKKRGSICG